MARRKVTNRNGFEHIALARKPMKYDCRDYRMLDFISLDARRRARETTIMDWPVAKILDQGSTPHCVGFAWAGFGIAVPVIQEWDNAMGDKIYYQAKVEDGEPGAENGSTTRSGVEAFLHYGLLQDGKYAFAQTIDDVITWVLANGPVVVGTYWHNDMFFPDSDGLVHPSGTIVGGHEWMIHGCDTIARRFHATNSWGESYGVKGQFQIGFDDFAGLLYNEGDACVAMEVAGNPPPEPTPEPPGCLTWLMRFKRN